MNFIKTFHIIFNFNTQLRSLSKVVKLYKPNSKFIQRKMDSNCKIRDNPIVVKLDSPAFKSILSDELYYLADLFQKYNHEIRIAGGAVRDLLVDKIPTDIDFATTATPSEMKEMFIAEDIRMINMNGEKHGTITPRIHDKENFEITTLRIDTATNGRHAIVEFTKDWILDANRRDLTINSMYLGLDGSVYDYFFGYEDLKKRRIAFVGNPDDRIKEDYLRILRYFRFYGRIAESSNMHEDEILQSITKNIDGLGNISGERIWSEIKKILQGNFACDIITALLKTGAAKHIGLPSSPNTEEFLRLKNILSESPSSFHPITLFSALLHDTAEAISLNDRLKFSVYERNLTYFLVQNRELTKDENSLLYYQKMSMATIGKVSDMKDYVEELLKYNGKFDLYIQLHNWIIPKFPVTTKTLLDNGSPPGEKLGIVMRQLKSIWMDSGFLSSPEDLLKELPVIISKLTNSSAPVSKKVKVKH